MKLDLGSGLTPYQPDDPDWRRLDLNPNAPLVDYICDAFGNLPFNDGQWDELRAVDLLEHAPYTRTDAVLAEWVRILKPGGTLFVQVPSGGTICRWYVADDPRLKMMGDRPCTAMEGVEWRLFGGLDDGKYVEEGGDWTLNLHAAVFDEPLLVRALTRAGLEIEEVVENAHPNLQAKARKP